MSASSSGLGTQVGVAAARSSADPMTRLVTLQSVSGSMTYSVHRAPCRTSSFWLQDAPRTLLGNPVDDASAVGLCRAYLSYVESVVSSAERAFGRGSDTDSR